MDARVGIEPGQNVILRDVPRDLLRGLPDEDQAAIRAIAGKPVMFAGYSFDQAELEFTDADGDRHSVWVDPALLQVA
jgi:hypothetical protein